MAPIAGNLTAEVAGVTSEAPRVSIIWACVCVVMLSVFFLRDTDGFADVVVGMELPGFGFSAQR